MSTLERLLESIPGWEGASWSELDGGLTNRSYLLEDKGRRAVLKVDESSRGIPFSSRVEEATVQSAAAAKGIAAPVLFASDTLYLTEYVEGEVWTRADLESVEQLDALAATLRELHALPLTGRRFDALGAAELYRRRIDASYADEADRCLAVVAAAETTAELRCCHNDLVAENIVSSPGVTLLDFEYASDNDPMFDLAIVVEHHSLSDPAERRLLDAYFGADAPDRRAELAAQRRVYAALSWLWDKSRR
ncbi:MAG: phosphotransferase [Woeseiaceae bacterium]|nr:phosphotransferase [Woeseiaceae bacterium]